MPVFQHPLWGYTLNYPDQWIHRHVQGAETFASREEALAEGYDGPDAGQVMVKAEWNSTLQPVEPLWNQHIGLMASMIGAKAVGSAPWKMGGANGLETEIGFPKQVNRRLWTGILSRDFLVLKFMVMHPKTARQQFEPQATLLIGSLRFPTHLFFTRANETGLPQPPGASATPIQEVLADVTDPENWRAYTAPGSIGALQAFYLRECPALGWRVEEFIPFPYPSDLGFARFKLVKDGAWVTLGLMPWAEPAQEGSLSADSPARIVIQVK